MEYTHLIANMYIKSIIINPEVDIILQEWSPGARRGKGHARYINDIIVRNLNSLHDGEQLQIVGRALHTLEGLEDT